MPRATILILCFFSSGCWMKLDRSSLDPPQQPDADDGSGEAEDDDSREEESGDTVDPDGPLVRSWAKTYGGMSNDEARSILATSDGGTIVAGYTASAGAGQKDIWVIKLDGNGQPEWQKAYGGPGSESAFEIIECLDRGYMIAGFTASFGSGEDDFLGLKLDADGEVRWQRALGGESHDSANTVAQTSDGGFVFAGTTQSFGASEIDLLVLKTDVDGDLAWAHMISHRNPVKAYSIMETGSGDFLVAGSVEISGQDDDLLLLRLTEQGAIGWQRKLNIPEDLEDKAFSIRRAPDGGYIIAGHISNYAAGDSDVLLVKLDETGEILWINTYGGTATEYVSCALPTPDSGCVVFGKTTSFGAGDADAWVLKLNTVGSVEWQRTYGGVEREGGEDIYSSGFSGDLALDGGYIVAGSTFSFGTGAFDVWVLKLDGQGDIPGACPDGMIRDSSAIPTLFPAGSNEVPLDVETLTGVDVDITLPTVEETFATIQVQCEI